jgi:hypothetical protein
MKPNELFTVLMYNPQIFHWFDRLFKRRVSAFVSAAILCGWFILSGNIDGKFDLRPGNRLVFKSDVFERGSASIAPQGTKQFAQLADYLRDRTNLVVEIIGYTDNLGDPARNLALSQARADAIKIFLTAHGVDTARTRTRGRGADSPIATNDNEEGRAQNRRIEVFGLSSFTERPLTSGHNTPLTADGRITAMLPPVKSLAPWDIDWHAARLNEPVYEYQRLTTGEKARVEITFTNKNRLQIAENSLVVVYGSQATPLEGKPDEQIRLVKGGLWVKLKSLQKDQALSVRTPNGEIALGESSAKIELDSDNRSLVSVHEGSANVKSADGSAMSVKQNFGTRVMPNLPPEQPRLLPPVPELLTPNIADSLHAGSITFQWRKKSLRIRFEIAESINFQRPIHAVVSTADSATVALSEGEWYVKLSAIDEVGLESRSSIYLLHVAKPLQPFRFYILTFTLFISGIFCGWWGSITKKRPIATTSICLLVLGCASFFLLHW